MINLSNFALADILPSVLKSTKEDRAMAAACTAILIRVFEEMDILDPFVIPEKLLDTVAVEEHVDFYDPILTVEQKRELIQNAFFFHQRKATPAAVEQLIQIVFSEGEVVEWFEYDADPGYFKVVTSNPAVTNELAEQFIRALNSVKRLSAWLDKVEITQVEQMNLYVGSVMHTGDKMTLRQVT